MLGLKLLPDNNEFLERLMDNKMLAVKASENVIRLFPPLTVEKKEIDEALNKLEKTCQG